MASMDLHYLLISITLLTLYFTMVLTGRITAPAPWMCQVCYDRCFAVVIPLAGIVFTGYSWRSLTLPSELCANIPFPNHLTNIIKNDFLLASLPMSSHVFIFLFFFLPFFFYAWHHRYSRMYYCLPIFGVAHCRTEPVKICSSILSFQIKDSSRHSRCFSGDDSTGSANPHCSEQQPLWDIFILAFPPSLTQVSPLLNSGFLE